MKKYILKSLFVSMLCMLAASCQDTDEFAQLDSRKAQVMFSVAMDSQMARSRTTWDDDTWDDDTWGDYTPSLKGDAYDNHIELNQLVVKIEAGGSPLYVENIVKWNDGEANEYKFVGIVEGVDTETTLTNVKISVFANMGTDGSMTTFEQDAENIPMWGMTSMDKLTLAPGTRQDLETIHLLRAMAKLEVSLNSDMAGEYALTGVKLNKHNPEGNCLPTIAEDAKYTTDLGLEAVMNVNESGTQSELAFTEAEAGKKYIVYLPEVENGTSEADYLNIEVELTVKDAEGNLTESVETGNFDVMDYSDVDNPTAIDIVRNHWYKYTVSGFAAGEVQVNYQTLDWQDVGIEIGGEGFLFLNKDVIEIYNSNIDEDQLKFSSSSPIKSIVLKDIYKHYRNGNILANSDAKAYEKEQGVLEEDFEADGVYAYYMDKFGVLTQLSNAEGSDEAAVLNSINASAVPVDDKGLNGGITINSPFINHETLGDSHFNTIRYLEFEVTNDQEYTATFRVMQYPPVVIMSEEGFYSYRDDFEVPTDEELYHNPDAFQSAFGKIRPTSNGPIHFQNPKSPFFTLAGFLPYHTHECTVDGTLKETDKSCPSTYEGYEELLYGFMERDYHRSYSFGGPIAGVFHRDHYVTNEGSHFIADELIIGGNENVYYQSLGPCYYDEGSGKYFRRHYTGNFFETFWPKVVRKVHTKSESVNVVDMSRSTYVYKNYTSNGQTASLLNAKNKYKSVTRNAGQADIYKVQPNSNYDGWGNYPVWEYYNYVWEYTNKNGWTNKTYKSRRHNNLPQAALFNHHMYHIKTTITPDQYKIGFPMLEDDNGILTYDTERGFTAEGEANTNMVSPSFMVASQLGETILPKNEHHYVMPGIGGIYYYARRQCQEYVETTYTDLNNNYKYDEGEPVTHYHDWRLPTKAEIDMIIRYQSNSRAMDVVLNGRNYYHASTSLGVYDENTCLSNEIPNYNTEFDGVYVRCVRDVRSNQNRN